MSLLHLRSFLAVYRYRSLTAAAEALGLTQPALSQHMAALESALGRRLFDRSRSGVAALTTADELHAALGDSIDHAEAVLARFRARSFEMSGVVRVAGPAEYIGDRFAPALTRLHQAGIELRIATGNKNAIYAMLLDGDVDLAVTASPPDNPKVGFAPIGEERFVLVAPPSMALPDDPNRLIREQPFCAYDVELPLIRQWCTANAISLPRHPPAIVIPDLRAIVHFVAAGSGWSVLPDYLCGSAIASRHIVQAFADRPQPANNLYLAWTKGKLRHPRVAFARDVLLEAASALC